MQLIGVKILALSLGVTNGHAIKVAKAWCLATANGSGKAAYEKAFRKQGRRLVFDASPSTVDLIVVWHMNGSSLRSMVKKGNP